MARRRFVQIDGELHEVTSDYVGERLTGAATNALLWNDRSYQDMGDPRFKSRSQHREFMKRNNLTTIDDYKDTWRQTEKNRMGVRQGVDPSRKHDIARAIEQLKSNSRRR